MNAQIASASEEQSSVSKEINKSIVHISDLAGETTRAADQTSDATIRISELSKRLRALIGEFEV